MENAPELTKRLLLKDISNSQGGMEATLPHKLYSRAPERMQTSVPVRLPKVKECTRRSIFCIAGGMVPKRAKIAHVRFQRFARSVLK